MKLKDVMKVIQPDILETIVSDTSRLDSIRVSGITANSKLIGKGNIFVCQKGLTSDGHLFIDDAIAMGTAAIFIQNPDYKPVIPGKTPVFLVSNTYEITAVLASSFYQDPSSKMFMIGVTGTDGKTTTTRLIEKIIHKSGVKSALSGTLGFYSSYSLLFFKWCQLELKLQALCARLKLMASPQQWSRQSISVQQLLSFCLRRGVKTCILEVTSHAIEQHRVYHCDFNLLVFTNLTREHLDYHGSIENYARTKSRLFSGLRHDGRKPQTTVLNLDDHYAPLIREACPTSTQILTYGIHQRDADVTPQKIQYSSEGTTFECHTPEGVIPVTTCLHGEFGVYNTLAAITAALSLNIPAQTIQKALSEFKPVTGRYQIVSQQSPCVIVDFAHTVNGVTQVLSTARNTMAHPGGRIISVHGFNPKMDTETRTLTAKAFLQLADVFVLTTFHPATSHPDETLVLTEQIHQWLSEDGSTQFRVEPDRIKAVQTAIEMANPEDTVIITGKGNEKYKSISVAAVNDDKGAALQAIRRLRSIKRSPES